MLQAHLQRRMEMMSGKEDVHEVSSIESEGGGEGVVVEGLEVGQSSWSRDTTPSFVICNVK
jgi:hypothetical protein